MNPQDSHAPCEHRPLNWLCSHKVALAALIAVAVLLVIEHWEHLLIALPYLLLLSCPLMHIFMHGGHHHGHDENKDSKDATHKGGCH